MRVAQMGLPILQQHMNWDFDNFIDESWMRQQSVDWQTKFLSYFLGSIP